MLMVYVVSMTQDGQCVLANGRIQGFDLSGAVADGASVRPMMVDGAGDPVKIGTTLFLRVETAEAETRKGKGGRIKKTAA